jgi:DNA repair exonuclease SbcCD ATPase subunit
MKVVLEGFRIYESATERTFPSSGTCLIQGESGRGKSTLFSAIAWALYGKESDTYSWTSKKKVCSVTVHLDDGAIVRRQKNPERLDLTLPDGKLLASRDEAQSEIVRRYGSLSAWTASAFLRQDKRNQMLEGTSADKVALLEALAFHEDLPAKYLEAAMERRRESGRLLDRTQAVVQHLKLPSPKTPLDILSHPATSDHYNDTMAEEVTQRLRAVEMAQRSMAERQVLLDQLTRKEKQLATISCWPDDFFQRAQKATPILTEYSYLLASYRNLPELPEELVPEQIDLYTAKWKAYEENKALCSTYGWKFDKSFLEQYATGLKDALKYLDDVPAWRAFTRKPRPSESHDPTQTVYNASYISETRQKEEAHRRWRTALKRLGFTPSEYEQALQKANRSVAIERYIPRYAAFTAAGEAYETHLKSIPECYADVEWNEDTIGFNLQLAMQKVALQRAGKDVHLCPNCHKGLRWVDGTLALASATPSTSEGLRQAAEEVAWITKLRKLDEELTRCENNMAECEFSEEELTQIKPAAILAAKELLALPIAPEPEVSADSMDRHNRWLDYAKEQATWSEWTPDRASKIESYYETIKASKTSAIQHLMACERLLASWVDPSEVQGLSLSLLAQLAEKNKLGQRIKELEDAIDAIGICEDAFLECNEDALQKERERRTTVAILNKEIKTLCFQIDALPKALDTSETLETLQTYASELTWMPRYLEDVQTYERAQKDLADAQKAHQTLLALIEKIKSVEHNVLTSYLETFNATLESILTDIFDDPITVTLQLFQGEKPDARWVLAYKGAQDRTLGELSGGEQDRVSLAVSLALASTSPFPALLLDECFGALDAISRERCLDTLRRILPHKPVLVIAHGETEGDYETTVNL